MNHQGTEPRSDVSHPSWLRVLVRPCRAALLLLLTLPLIFSLAGCGIFSPPNPAVLKLIREKDHLSEQVADLKLKRDADTQTIQWYENKLAGKTPTTPTLPPAELKNLFTTKGLKIGRLTGEADLNYGKPDEPGLKVYVVPVDEQGDKLKAGGSFTIEAFDLAAADTHLGQWTFTDRQARDAWLGGALMYTYVLKCPWQKPPEHEDLTVKITFHDALTGQDFTEQRIVKVPLPLQPPPTPVPATTPTAVESPATAPASTTPSLGDTPAPPPATSP